MQLQGFRWSEMHTRSTVVLCLTFHRGQPSLGTRSPPSGIKVRIKSIGARRCLSNLCSAFCQTVYLSYTFTSRLEPSPSVSALGAASYRLLSHCRDCPNPPEDLVAGEAGWLFDTRNLILAPGRYACVDLPQTAQTRTDY